MYASEFVEQITGKPMHYERRCLATGRVDESFQVIPSQPRFHGSGCSVVINSIHCYDDEDCLFTQDFGVYVAVVKTGSGHLFCDTFRPVEE